MSPLTRVLKHPLHPRIDNNKKVLFTLHYLTIFCLVSEACYILIDINMYFYYQWILMQQNSAS